MNKSPKDKAGLYIHIPRAWGIQISLIFLIVAPQALAGFVSDNASISPVAIILVLMSGYAGHLVWTQNGKYPIASTENLFYIESKKVECSTLHRSCWHLTMGLMLIMVFMTLQGIF